MVEERRGEIAIEFKTGSLSKKKSKVKQRNKVINKFVKKFGIKHSLYNLNETNITKSQINLIINNNQIAFLLQCHFLLDLSYHPK